MRLLKNLQQLVNSGRDYEETIKALALLTTADGVVSEQERKAVANFLGQTFPPAQYGDLMQLYQLQVDRMFDPRVLQSEKTNLLGKLKTMSSNKRVALAGFLQTLADVDGRQPEELPVISAIQKALQN